MSMCSRCGFEHEGVGQSPEHPVEISFGWVVVLIAGLIFFVGITWLLS